MASWNHYGAGVGNAASYLVSGQPFITGSAALPSVSQDCIKFPFVTKRIVVISSGSAAIRVHFAPTGSHDGSTEGEAGATLNRVNEQHHFIQLDGDEESVSLSAKCKEIWISSIGDDEGNDAGYKLYAELTRISAGEMYHLTGSGIAT